MPMDIREIRWQFEWEAELSRLGSFQTRENYVNLTVDSPSEISIGSPKTRLLAAHERHGAARGKKTAE